MIQIRSTQGARLKQSEDMAKPNSKGECPEGHYLHVDRDGGKFCVKMHPGVNYSGLIRNAAGFLQRVAQAVSTDSRPCGGCGKRK